MSFGKQIKICIVGIDVATGEKYIWGNSKESFLQNLPMIEIKDEWEKETREFLEKKFNINKNWISLFIYCVDFFSDNVILTVGGVLPYDSLLFVENEKWVCFTNVSQDILDLGQKILND